MFRVNERKLNGDTLLRTNLGNFEASINCLQTDIIPPNAEDGIELDGADNIIFRLPEEGLTCFVYMLGADLERDSVPSGMVTEKDDKAKRAQIKEIRQNMLAGRIRLTDYPDAEDIRIELEPDKRQITRVNIDEKDPAKVEMVKRLLQEMNLSESDSFPKRVGMRLLQALQLKFNERIKESGRLFHIKEVRDVKGDIEIDIVSSPIPKMVEVYDISDPNGDTDDGGNAIRAILQRMLKDRASMAAYCSNDEKLFRAINEAMSKDPDLIASDYDYRIVDWSVDPRNGSILRINITKERSKAFQIGAMSNMSDEERNMLRPLQDKPLNRRALRQRLKQIEQTMAEGFILVPRMRPSGHKGVEFLDISKVPKRPKEIRVKGDFPPSQTKYILAAFGTTPQDGWTEESLLGSYDPSERRGIASVIEYLRKKRAVIRDIMVEGDGEDLVIRLRLAEFGPGKVISYELKGKKGNDTAERIQFAGLIDDQPTEKQKALMERRVSEAFQELIDKYGDNGRYIIDETLDFLADRLKRVGNIDRLEPVVVEDNGRAAVNFIANAPEFKHQIVKLRFAYSSFGVNLLGGYQYIWNNGLSLGGEVNWQGTAGRHKEDWTTNTLMARLFVDKKFDDENELYVSVVGFYTNFGPKLPDDKKDPASTIQQDSTPGGVKAGISTEVRYVRRIGDHLSIDLGNVVDVFFKKNENEGFNGQPLRDKFDISITATDSTQRFIFRAGIGGSVGAANYLEGRVSATYIQPIDLQSAEEYVRKVQDGESSHIPIMKFTVSGGGQLFNVPIFEQMTPASEGALFPVNFMNPEFIHGKYFAGGNISYEHPLDDDIKLLIGGQAYIVGGNFRWGAAAGLSLIGLKIWFGWGSNGLLVFVSPDELLDRVNNFRTMKDQIGENNVKRDRLLRKENITK